jgi:hypothetical protein
VADAVTTVADAVFRAVAVEAVAAEAVAILAVVAAVGADIKPIRAICPNSTVSTLLRVVTVVSTIVARMRRASSLRASTITVWRLQLRLRLPRR